MADKYNGERYYDKTAYLAMKKLDEDLRVARFRPVVYICSPYRGNEDENSLKAQYYCRFAVESGAIPIAPHIYFTQFMYDDRPEEREAAIFMNKVLLSKCHELWLFGENVTEGMKRELGWAENRGMKIRKFTEDLEEII